ncbi:hypothetical protein CXF85_04255 [Colwellia sp. 75C3]|uniref:hypothetical protein n=1 Tax=Colwellia sp. 75C3 TaxID=888425 RepID=UPI000C328E6C|nr:hypothetical protein [Colwellia sp. 75C3]PKG85990.1 hypothetical protein CXF85_04255 [Colwellia sp. 75C3]
MTNAERSKKARDKKAANKLVTINTTLNKRDSELYNLMIASGFDLNKIVDMAYTYSLTLDSD